VAGIISATHAIRGTQVTTITQHDGQFGQGIPGRNGTGAVGPLAARETNGREFETQRNDQWVISQGLLLPGLAMTVFNYAALLYNDIVDEGPLP